MDNNSASAVGLGGNDVFESAVIGWKNAAIATVVRERPVNALEQKDSNSAPPVANTAAIEYRVIVADDHPIFREALVGCVRRSIAVSELLEAWDLPSLQAAIACASEFDLLVMDLTMPGVHGLSALVHVRAMAPGIAVIVISDLESRELLQRAIALGAAGFVAKSSLMSDISHALTTVITGGIGVANAEDDALRQDQGLSAMERNAARRVSTLTPQQYRIATLLTWGMNNKQICWELGIKESSVKAHLSSIFQALQVRNRTQVALLIKLLDFERPNLLASSSHFVSAPSPGNL